MWIRFVCGGCGVRVLTYRWTNYRTIPPTRDDRDLCGECKMSLLNESWPKMQCPKCFMRYYGPGEHKCPQGPLLNEDGDEVLNNSWNDKLRNIDAEYYDGVSLTNIAHPRPWYWWITWLWYRLFPPKIDEATLESILIAIRKQVDAGGKKILIKPTKVIYRPADRE